MPKAVKSPENQFFNISIEEFHIDETKKMKIKKASKIFWRL